MLFVFTTYIKKTVKNV